MKPDRARHGAPLLTIEGAGVRRGDRWVLAGIDLAVHAREIVTLIGPNGSGKTTTAKLALGLLKPDRGRVTRKQGLVVGYVPQRLHVDWTLPLSVERFLRLTSRPSRAAIEAALHSVEIGHLFDAQIRTLSGGEMQRVLLARAIIRNPELLVLDEPVQGVDFTGEVALYELICKVRDRIGCGILLISHDLHIVMSETDTVVCLNGHVCCQGTPESVAQSPEYVRLFGRRAAEALAVYRHDHDHVHRPDGKIDDGHGHGHAHGHGHGHFLGPGPGQGPAHGPGHGPAQPGRDANAARRPEADSA
ncbi:MAG: metal ABC transporter ATP-binding protein [Proteobacteria bacterium]|nr:metal ABC transporter ATP-binding protein [Pseudomonadota bacterium]